MTDRDRQWAAALAEFAIAPMMRWPMHLATKGRITVFTPDDLTGEGLTSNRLTR